MTKSVLLCFLAMQFTTLGALAQECERTLTVGFVAPKPSALEPADIQAMLGKQALTVVKVEPIRSSRVLILIASEFRELKRDKDLKQLTNRLAAIDRIPPNIAIAYALEEGRKIAFSGGFTSDPQELRNNLQKLVSGSFTATHIRSTASETLDFFGQPQAGDAVVAILAGSANVWVKKEDFLEKGIRLFVVPLYLDFHDDDSLEQSEATGGHWMLLGSSSTLKKEEEANWRSTQDFLMNGISVGYMVTVSVPRGIRVKPFSWALGGRGVTVHSVKVSPEGLAIDYPDLLLCDNNAKDRVAGAVRPRRWWLR